MSAFPGKILGPDGPAVQRVADLHPDRERVAAFSLIVNVFAVVLPGQAAVSALAEFLVTLGVLDIGKPRTVDDCPIRSAAAQHGFHRHLPGFSVCSGFDINRLFLVFVCLFPLLLLCPGERFGRCRFRSRCRGRTRCRRHRRIRIRQGFQRAAAYQKPTAKERT